MPKSLAVVFLGCILFASCAEKQVTVRNDPVLNGKLIDAVKEKNVASVKKFLSKGADPNAVIPGGKNTVFHLALYVNDSATIETLLDSGADIAKPDQTNYAPLSLAARANNAKIVNRLIDNGADVNTVNNNTIRSTPIMDAAEANACDALKILIDRGADKDAVDKWNAPAITIAADKNNIEAVTILAEAGAELNIIDSGKGYTALDFAIKNKNDAMINLLASKGAKPNVFKK